MFRTHTTHSITVGDVDCEVTHEPVHGSEITKQVGDKVVVAYLVHDTDYDVEDLMGDCMGKLLSLHRHSRDADEALDAMGVTRNGDPDLEAVWRDHDDVATDRYLKQIRKDYSFKEVRDTLNNDEVRSWADAIEALTYAASGACCDGLEFNSVMQDVLETMWAEPEFFPGDRDAQILDCYEHSGQHWSLSGGGTQCRWDTANGAGVWVPDGYLREELDSAAPQAVYALVKATSWVRGHGKSYQLLEVKWSDNTNNEQVCIKFSDDPSELHVLAKEIAAGKPAPTTKQLAWGRWHQAEIYAQQFLDTYNAIIGGRVYGCVVETFDLEGDQISEDACWGFVGDYAEEALKAEYFDPACTKAAKAGDCV